MISSGRRGLSLWRPASKFEGENAPLALLFGEGGPYPQHSRPSGSVGFVSANPSTARRTSHPI